MPTFTTATVNAGPAGGSEALAEVPSTALLTDMYELTMLDAALADGTAAKPAVFEAYTRRLPDDSEYGIVVGTDRAVDAVLSFRFTAAQIAYLRGLGGLSEECLDYLASYHFTGNVYARPEGEAFTAGSPIMMVEGTFGEAVLLETVVLSALNHGCTIATAAASIVGATKGKPVIEMGSRRTHEAFAVDAARAAWVAGFAATSNLEAGMRYGIPVSGTAAHAWTLAHVEETEAFAAQLASLGTGTTLLVDTYGVPGGIANAVAAAKALGASGPGGVRIDSGDPYEVVPAARAQLDRLGATATKIVVTGDLDAAQIARFEAARLPIDAYGVGTRLVGSYPVGLVYKLTEITDGATVAARPVAKSSPGKLAQGGAKRAFKMTRSGRIVGELLVPAASAGAMGPERAIDAGAMWPELAAGAGAMRPEPAAGAGSMRPEPVAGAGARGPDPADGTDLALELNRAEAWDKLMIAAGVDARTGTTVSRTVEARARFERTVATVDRLPIYCEGF
jgi:nicotinate phosphoribosyltransferase